MTYDLQHVQPLPSDLSDRTLSVNLILPQSGKISVRSCEIVGRRFRNRVSFSDANDFEDVLKDKLARSLRKCIERLPDGAHVMSLPEFLVELPGLVLSGVHIMIMDIKNGVRNAIFRFKEFVGSVNQAFKVDLGIEEPVASYNERLAINVLSDICLPILNLSREMEFAFSQSDRGLPQQFEDRMREFEFQTELLKRFIHNAAIDNDTREAEMLAAPMRTDRIRWLTINS